MKFCINCKYYQDLNLKTRLDLAYCHYKAGEIKSIDPVTGNISTYYSIEPTFCTVAREFESYCGENAKWFEPKEVKTEINKEKKVGFFENLFTKVATYFFRI